MKLSLLSEPFRRDAVHWRAQTLTPDGDKALALAYLDARDVMDRLDAVVGPENWAEEISETPKGRVICRLGIKCGDEWVWKSDGAGDTAVEGEKGGISDALKRAAVHWGIGRYLYRVGSPWVPCKTSDYNGKKRWKAWDADPWEFVKNPPVAPQDVARDIFNSIKEGVPADELKKQYGNHFDAIEVLSPVAWQQHIKPKLELAA